MFSKRFYIQHKVSFAILLFLILFGSIHIAKPALLYDTDGSFRSFGVGYKNKTILPIWLVAVILAILCYMAVVWYITIRYNL